MAIAQPAGSSRECRGRRLDSSRAARLRNGIRIPHDSAPEPPTIAEIAAGAAPGNRVAAIEAFRRLGVVAGDVLAQALTLVDGLAGFGGGFAGGAALFF